MSESELTKKLQKIFEDFKLEDQSRIIYYTLQYDVDYKDHPEHLIDHNLQLDNQNPLQPYIAIDHVQNLIVNDPETTPNRIFTIAEDLCFVPWKSKRRSFRKKLKKIAKKADKLCQEMLRIEAESLDDLRFEDQM